MRWSHVRLFSCAAILLCALLYINRSHNSKTSTATSSKYTPTEYADSATYYNRYLQFSQPSSYGTVHTSDMTYMYDSMPTCYAARLMWMTKTYDTELQQWIPNSTPQLQYIAPSECAGVYQRSRDAYESFPAAIRTAVDVLQDILLAADHDDVPYLDILINVAPDVEPSSRLLFHHSQYSANATLDAAVGCINKNAIQSTFTELHDRGVMTQQQCAEAALQAGSTHYAMTGQHTGTCHVKHSNFNPRDHWNHQQACGKMMSEQMVHCNAKNADLVHLYQTIHCEVLQHEWVRHKFVDRMPALFTWAVQPYEQQLHTGYFDIPLIPPHIDAMTSQYAASVLTTLSQYSRLLTPPWSDGRTINDIPKPCNVSRCFTSCCCTNECVHNVAPPADNAELFPQIRTYDTAARSVLPAGGRIALVFSGELRSFVDTYSFNKMFVLDSATAPYDIFMHAWSTDVQHTMDTIHRVLTYHDDTAVIQVEQPPHVPDQLLSAIRCRMHSTTATNAFTLQAESLRRADAMRQQAELTAGYKYKWVARMRYDFAAKVSFWPTVQLYDVAHPANNPIFYPACGEFMDGMNDQFAVGSSDAMVGYTSKSHWIDRCLGDNLPHGMHPETCFRALAQMDNMAHTTIHKIDVCYGILRSDTCMQGGRYGFECCRRTCDVNDYGVVEFAPSSTAWPCLPGETETQCNDRKRQLQAKC